MKDQETTPTHVKDQLNEVNYKKVEFLAKEIAKKLVKELHGQNISGPLQLQLLGNEFSEDEISLHQVSCEIELSDDPVIGEIKYRHYPTMIGPFITDRLRRTYYTYKESAIIDEEKNIMIGVSDSKEINSAINNLTSTGFSATAIKKALTKIAAKIRYRRYSSLDTLRDDIRELRGMAPNMTTREVLSDINNIISNENESQQLDRDEETLVDEPVYTITNSPPVIPEINEDELREGTHNIYRTINELDESIDNNAEVLDLSPEEIAERFDIAVDRNRNRIDTEELSLNRRARRLSHLENGRGAEIDIEIAETPNELPIDPNINNNEESEPPEPHTDEIQEVIEETVGNVERLLFRRI
jgi:phage terminase Nu1 subunit (DNA packaging protein)